MYKPLNKITHLSNGRVISNITDDGDKIINFLEKDFPELSEEIIVSLIMGITTFYFDKKIFFIVLVLTSVSAIAIWESKKIYELENERMRLKDEENQFAGQLFTAIPILKLYKDMQRLWQEYLIIADNIKEAERKKSEISMALATISFVCNMVREIAIIVIGIMFSGLNIGEIVALLNISSFFSQISASAVDLYIKANECEASVDRIINIFQEAAEEVDADNKVLMHVDKLEAENLVYLYDGQIGLKHFTGTFSIGQLNVISGSIGTGKSTLIKLICGLYPAQKGNIKFDGHKQTLNQLRSNAAYVNQENTILEGSIVENITCFEKEPDKDHVWRILEFMGLKSWVDAFPDGIEHKLNIELNNLSGGQRQRIALARALYSERPVLIPDEPTASLDKATSEDVMELLNKIRDSKLVIVVTHEPALIVRADNIVEISA